MVPMISFNIEKCFILSKQSIMIQSDLDIVSPALNV